MIKSIYAFTNNGLPILNWNYDISLKDFPAHELLVSGVVSAVQSLVRDVFLTRLQRIELENDVVVLTGKDFTDENNKSGNSNRILIISALVDKKDNNTLVDKILLEILDEFGRNFNFERKDLIEQVDISEFIDDLIKKKTRRRSWINFSLSLLLVFVALNFASLYYNYKFDLIFSDVTQQTLVQVGGGTILGFILVIPASFVAGKITWSVISGFIGTFAGAFFTDYIFRFIIDIDVFNKSVGTFAAYLLISIFVGIIGGYIGGYIAERLFLFPISKDPREVTL
ncbi:MAG: hypothetical protein ACW981_09640 [Candidatus Hodarchaeales archaeon]